MANQLLLLVAIASLGGCVAEQTDLKQTEKSLQQSITQSNQELAQTRARQNQEIAMLREQDLPQLRDELERAMHQMKEVQQSQDDLKHRLALLEHQKSGGMEEANTERRLDALDVILGKILLRMETLEKRLQALEKS
jgi:uncharacterized protein HemX